ncbi:unnamed protein product [Urochloa decumbens]|uniref:Uncharacterized protein n=1 Tax=Urochloa decumbens TaxID=240449 RepID=A0ABC9AFH8_9POAL
MRGFKIIRKRFRFCRRDEFGTRSHRGGREFVKITPLGLELSLRTDLRIITETCYKMDGIHGWDAYQQHLPAIRAHIATLAAALRRYKARRVERGLFHFVPMKKSVGFWILSPLRAPPGAERKALDKWRRQRQKRAAAAALLLKKKPMDQACASLGEMKARLMTPSAVLYVAYLVFVSVLSCMVLFL